MQLIQREEASHWYLRDGTPFHEVEMKSRKGEMRPTTVRDAREHRALPSVTNILGVMAAPQLEAWKREQAVLAALTLPRIEGETDDAFARRVVSDADSVSKEAMDLGTRVHAVAEAYVRGETLPVDFEACAVFDPAKSIIDQLVGEITHVESVLTNARDGYAGRVDLVAKDRNGRPLVIDFKTQNVKSGKTGKPMPSYYDKWPLQLSAYAMAMGHHECGLISLVISTSGTPFATFKDWTADTDGTVRDYYLAFTSAAYLWRYMKGYDPREEGGAA